MNNSTVILEYMRKVRTVFCPDFLAQSYITSVFITSSVCALQAFICRTHSIWFSAFSFSVTPFCSASDRTISSMRFRAASSISAQCSKSLSDRGRHPFCFSLDSAVIVIANILGNRLREGFKGGIVYQAAKAGTNHHHSVSPRLSKLIKQAQIRAAPAAKPKDDRLIFMLNL